jgi:virginiamycin B lyase
MKSTFRTTWGTRLLHGSGRRIGKSTFVPALLLASLAAGMVLAVGLSSASGGSISSAGAARASVAPSVAPVVAGSFTGGIDARAVGHRGESFFKATIEKVLYESGPAILSGSQGGTASTLVDDVLVLSIVHQDGTKSTFKHDYNSGCAGLSPLGPTDLSAKFRPGENTVTAKLMDNCGGEVSAGALWLTPPVRHLYWSNYLAHTIGRANVDGTEVNQSLISTNSNPPEGVAVDSGHVYWSNIGADTIGRANLDGTGVNQSFISGGIGLASVAVDSNHIYWANYLADTIGRANLDGTGVNQSFISTGTNSNPHGLAVDGNHIYWGNFSTHTIGRANLDGTGVNPSFISTDSNTNPTGVAVDSGHIYWSNWADVGSIGRANLDGTGVNQSFISDAAKPVGVEVDSNYIYWSNYNFGSIGRANLDGTGVNQTFIIDSFGTEGLAVEAG